MSFGNKIVEAPLLCERQAGGMRVCRECGAAAAKDELLKKTADSRFSFRPITLPNFLSPGVITGIPSPTRIRLSLGNTFIEAHCCADDRQE